MGERVILLLILCLRAMLGSANLQPHDLKITLETTHEAVNAKEIIPLYLKIENVSDHRGNILIPYGQNTGKVLFQLRVYQIDSRNKYALVYTSPLNLDMDTSNYKATEGFWQLEPGESYTQPFFINDFKNARKRVESNFTLPAMREGKYAFQVIYLPENSIYFKYAFIKQETPDPIPEDDVESYPDHFKWEGSFASNRVEIQFSDDIHSSFQPNTKHCSLCKHICKEHWERVKKKWDDRSKEILHPGILWVYSGPQAVLESLPTFYSYDAILLSESGIQYVSFNYQLGKIFKVRSRLSSIFYAIGFRRSPFKTSKENWCKLVRIAEW